MRWTTIGRAAALVVLAATCMASASATAATHVRKPPPALTMPRHPDGLSRALASGRLTPAREALLRAEALFHRARVAARYGSVARPGPHDATLILRDLVARAGALSAADQARA